MLRPSLSLLVVLFAVAPATGQDGPERPDPVPRLALVPFAGPAPAGDEGLPEPLVALSELDGASFSLTLQRALAASKRVRVIDRRRVELLRKERRLADVGLVDPARSAGLDKALGADLLLLGDLLLAESSVTWSQVPFSKEGKELRLIRVRLVADGRVVDARTSQIRFVFRAEAIWEQKKMFPNRFETGEAPSQLPQALRDELARDVVRTLEEGLHPTTLEALADGRYRLTRSVPLELRVGQRVRVVRPARPAERVHGEVVTPAAAEIELGELQVESVDGKHARARALSGAPFEAGAVVRSASGGAAPPRTPARKAPAGW